MALKRRKFLKNLGMAIPMVVMPWNKLWGKEPLEISPKITKRKTSFAQDFGKLNDRVWIGKSFWSVPMEDWEIQKGRLEFSGYKKNARLHVLGHVLQEGNGSFQLEGKLGLLNKIDDIGSVGFTAGIKDTTDPESIKAACYFGQGVAAGISLSGSIFLGEKRALLPRTFNFENFNLKLNGDTIIGKTELTLTATDNKGITRNITYQTGELDGLVALENNMLEEGKSTFWWSEMTFTGDKIQHKPDNDFGPILWSMYTLSEARLKIMAQLPPIGGKDSKKLELQFLKGNKWKRESVIEMDNTSYACHFVVDNWDSGLDIPYRIVYRIDGEKHRYEGRIRKEPLNRPLRFGGLTCQESSGYPYRPLVENLEKTDPDMLYFSGDQLYESNGGYPIKREPEDKAILSYLGKWYMFGWTFGNVMRDRPTICTPDDHDVFQGNIWGEGGEGISIEEWNKVMDAHGGLVQTPKMINVVGRTQCGHLPDPYDAMPMKSDINTWFTSLNYGNVSFAIISDRLFKSGPDRIRKGTGRIDHIKERPELNELESDTLTFLGKRQLDFLNDWIGNWDGVNMKVLLSQTLFSNVGTHHGPEKEFLFGDMDSGGWPKTQRDAVIRILRKGCAFHINGDQHVPFIVQYSVDEPRDGGYTFCTPAISTGYIRWGAPDLVNIPFSDRAMHNLPNTGCYKDIFGNDNYVYAVGNPEDDYTQEKSRYGRAQKKASGFGLVTFDTDKRTIKMEAFRFLANLNQESSLNTYPGWPLTINQIDNDGRRAIGYLPRLQLKIPNQVVKIINEDSNQLVQSIRIKGNEFIPPVFKTGNYTLLIGEGTEIKSIKGLQISNDPLEVISP